MMMSDFKGKDWPQEVLVGWAGGNYTLKCSCGTWCLADKRAYQCYPCAVKAKEEQIENNKGMGI